MTDAAEKFHRHRTISGERSDAGRRGRHGRMISMSLAPTPRPLHWDYLGRVPYAAAVEMQHAARAAVKTNEGPERFLLLEHPHVYTLGRNAGEQDVLASPEWLAARGVTLAECDRGGQ